MTDVVREVRQELLDWEAVVSYSRRVIGGRAEVGGIVVNRDEVVCGVVVSVGGVLLYKALGTCTYLGNMLAGNSGLEADQKRTLY